MIININEANYLSLDTLTLTSIIIDKYTMTTEMINTFLSKEFPLLSTLNCTETCISSIPATNMPNLTKLICSYCNKLCYIPSLNKLTHLECNMCYNLTDIHILNSLTILSCIGCSKLTSIPMLNNLTSLYCDRCFDLATIPELQQLQKLSCNGCIALTTIPLLPNLIVLDCGSCRNLTKISVLPNLSTLYCNRCPKLTIIPILPLLTCFVFENSNNILLHTIPLEFQNLDDLSSDLINQAIEYNNLNLEYLETLLNNNTCNHSQHELVSEIVSKCILVKPACRF